jgi:Kef-type K+ transport system membrane component KefB/nucleotide-binding universal stress UspA family protein
MKTTARIFCLAAAISGMATLAAAASRTPQGTGLGGSGEVILIAQIALLLVVGRGLGEFMQRLGQPAVVGQLLAGLILGPSLFGWVWPAAHALVFPDTSQQKNLVAGISDVGVLMLLLLTGMETDLKLVRKVGKPAAAVAAAGVAVPFACGFAMAFVLPATLLPSTQSRLVAALFLGTALSISSIKIVAMVVREMNFLRRNLGQIIVASSIIEDTIGWIIISLTLGIAAQGGFSLVPFGKTIFGTAVFLALSYTFGRRIVFTIIRWVNDTFVSEFAVVTAILIVMCVMALITQAIGVNTVLGAFVAGVLVGQSPIRSQHVDEQLRGLITAFFMPVFFGLSGLSADLTILRDPHIALLALGLVALATFGKLGGAFIGGRLGGLSTRESLALGCAMNARGSTEVIVATIGLTMGALTQTLYSLIVAMAVITTMAMPPMLRWALGRLPISGEEKERLEKEEIDAKGFVSQFERLLIMADESANGKFATRIAGFIAGHRGIPLTVLKLDETGSEAGTDTAPLHQEATEGAKEGHRAAETEKGEGRQEKADISARAESELDSEAVTREANKGYDLLFIGLSRMRTSGGKFSSQVDDAVSGFQGPVAIAFAGHDTDLSHGFRILVPVNGTPASRRGAEIAFALSPAHESAITALYVAERSKTDARRGRKASVRRETERAVLEDAVALGERYGHDDMETAVHCETAPEDAIVEEAEYMGANLIVIGADLRVGHSVYLGQTVERILQTWRGGLVIVGV